MKSIPSDCKNNYEDQVPSTLKIPFLITQSELTDLIRDFDLLKKKSELVLGSRLKLCHHRQSDFNITARDIPHNSNVLMFNV